MDDLTLVIEEVQQINDAYDAQIHEINQKIESLTTDIQAANITIKAIVNKVEDPQQISELIRELDSLQTTNNPTTNSGWLFARTYLENIRQVRELHPEITYANANDFLPEVAEEQRQLQEQVTSLEALLQTQAELSSLLEESRRKEERVVSARTALNRETEKHVHLLGEYRHLIKEDPLVSLQEKLTHIEGVRERVASRNNRLTAIRNTNSLRVAILRKRFLLQQKGTYVNPH